MLIVVADGHIGAGASLGDRLNDQRSSWLRVCTAAAELQADVIHAGDVFHARRPGPREMRVFQAGLDVLREGGRTLLIAAGNHDVADAATPTAAEAACAGYDAHVWREPTTIQTEDGIVSFLPWMPPRMTAKETSEALMIVAESLAEQGARLLVAHWALAGGSLPNGLPLLELAEPMLDPYALAQMFEITLAGHIHQRQSIVVEPVVAHIGPLSRTNFGEASVETGAWQIASRFEGLEASWFEVPDRAFVAITEDLRGIREPEREIIDAICTRDDVKDAIVRVTYQQTADQTISPAAILTALQEYAGARHVERVTPLVERAASTRSVGVSETTDPRESWDAWMDAQADLASDETLATVREEAHTRIGGAA